MSYDITGRLVQKGEVEAKGKDGTFLSRTFAIEIEGRYPEFPSFQLVQDRCDLIDRFNVGDLITVSFDLRGREWQGKYFTNLNAWRVVPADGEPHKASAPADVTEAAPAITWNAPATPLDVPELIGKDTEPDDLPF